MFNELKSWRNGEVRNALVGFIDAVTTPASSDFLPETERVAVFSHDGVLWCAWPLPPEALFARARLQALAAVTPALGDREPFTKLMARDMHQIEEVGRRRLYEVMAAVHAGEDAATFRSLARAWVETTPNPELILPIARLAYLPQKELIACLHRRAFRCFIVSAGDTAFIQAVSQSLYGIPPERVIGSACGLSLRTAAGGARLLRQAEVQRFNSGEAKVESIERQIGQRPVLAFGASDADLAMLAYAQEATPRGLALMLHHDDAVGEAAYDREYRLAPLAEGLVRGKELGLVQVSMKQDWKTIFA